MPIPRLTQFEIKAFANMDSIKAHQVAVYVMCGDGFPGKMAAENPAIFTIDDRRGALPYSRRKIMQAVEVLAALAMEAGLDPRHMPPCPTFHNCGGIF